MTVIPQGKNEQGMKIGIHSIRGGTIAGEHSIIFAGNDEIIELKHTANIQGSVCRRSPESGGFSLW